MGATAAQLALMDTHTWFVRPATGRSAFGAAPSTGAVPAASRLVGPYPSRLTSNRMPNWGLENTEMSENGTLIVATTVAPSTTIVAALVSNTTVASAGKVYAIAGVRVFYDDQGVHHATLTLGRNP